MIYAKDMNIYDDYLDNFNHQYKLAKSEKYKLPYMYQHYFRRGNYLINGKIEDIYLSTWMSKVREIDNKRISIGILEFPTNTYVLRITHWDKSHIGTTKWYEGLVNIPSWEEIEQYVRNDF